MATQPPAHRTVGELRASGYLPRSIRDELRTHVAQFVTKFKIPARVVFLDELPKNPTGKIQKRALREQFADILSAN